MIQYVDTFVLDLLILRLKVKALLLKTEFTNLF